MPRVYDRTPRAQDDKNPLKNLLNFDSIDAAALTAGSAITGFLDDIVGTALNGVVEFIQELTGVDLSVLQPIIDAIQGFLSGLGGVFTGDPTQLFGFLTNLQDFLSFDFLSEAFDPIAAASSFWQLILSPTGLPVSVPDVLGATLPLTLPFTLGDAPDSPVQFWFSNLRGFLPFDLANPLLDFAEAAALLIENVLKPTGLLAWLEPLTGLLPDELSPQALLDGFQNIVNAFLGASPITGPWSGLFDFFTGSVQKAATNSSSILALEQAVFAESPADGILESFSGADENPISGWTQHVNSGSGGGAMARVNNGLVWAPTFSATTQTNIIVRDTDHLSSTTQKTTHLLRKKVDFQGAATYWMFLRANHTGTAGVFDGQYLRITAGTAARFGYMLNGVATDLSSADDPGLAPIPFTTTENDRWDFQVGNPAGGDDWLWRAWLNNTEITPAGGVSFDLTTLDAGASVFLDSDHDFPAIGMTSYGVFIFFPQQIPPTEVEGASWQVPAA